MLVEFDSFSDVAPLLPSPGRDLDDEDVGEVCLKKVPPPFILQMGFLQRRKKIAQKRAEINFG